MKWKVQLFAVTGGFYRDSVGLLKRERRNCNGTVVNEKEDVI